MIEEITIRVYPATGWMHSTAPGFRTLEIDVIHGKMKSSVSRLIKIDEFTSFYDQIMDDIVRELKQEIFKTKPKP